MKITTILALMDLKNDCYAWKEVQSCENYIELKDIYLDYIGPESIIDFQELFREITK